MKKRTKGILQLNASTLSISIDGPVAKYLQHISPIIITFYRSLFAIPVLFFYLLWKKEKLTLPLKKDYYWMLLIGILSALTTITAFMAIQVSNVAIGLLSIYTSPIILAFLEPFFFKARILWFDFLSAVVTFLGLFIIVPELSISSSVLQGIFWGTLTAFFVAFLLIIIRKKVETISGTLMTLYGNFFTICLLVPFCFWLKNPTSMLDYGYLILLGVMASAFGHALGSHAMKYVSATTASIVSALEPVYAVLLAFLWLGEIPELRTIIGGTIILSVVIFESIKHKWITEPSVV